MPTSERLLEVMPIPPTKLVDGTLAAVDAPLATTAHHQDGVVAEQPDVPAHRRARARHGQSGEGVRRTTTVCDVSHRPDWPALLRRAVAIVNSYDTLVTLRQLFYRLVAAELLPNSTNAYKSLSKYTAEARRAGTFPALIDRGRTIHRYQSFCSAAAARQWLKGIYRRDRTEGQTVSLYLGGREGGHRGTAPGMVRGPRAAGARARRLRLADLRRRRVTDVQAAGRRAVLLYAGDHDPSGEDIDRDFVERTDCWCEVRRVALTAAQVMEYALPPQPGKDTDSRAAAFVERHGRLVQVELDALPPDVLRDLFAAAIAEFWNSSVYKEVLNREDRDRRILEGRA